ncbi:MULTISPECIES: thioredoxin family protein [unclassified Virgibacillus]|uniref:thioredoxin family protein n=1 Tax=unclassified Virgibacillus TaxID=2620237 RepID=UPI0024DE250B|nr:thioredoxin family protein [Virgibacillus sp. LDC-1]
MELEAWFEKGLFPDDYIEAMEKNKESLLYIYDHFQAHDRNYDQLKKRKLRVIVLTEDWCGDAMLNIPILLRIAEQTAMDVRFLFRDENLELMDNYLTNGTARSIPIFIFIDEAGREVARWGPRAESIQNFVDESLSSLPPKDTADYEQKAKEMYMFMNKSYQENTDFWDAVHQSIIDRLDNCL